MIRTRRSAAFAASSALEAADAADAAGPPRERARPLFRAMTKLLAGMQDDPARDTTTVGSPSSRSRIAPSPR